MNDVFETLIGGLTDGEVGICDRFLPAPLALALQQNLLRLDAAGLLRSAGIGNYPVKDENQQTRGDRIRWMDKDSKDEAEILFFKLVGEFISYLNASCYTGINAFEFHYALYNTGSFYRRHVDQFKTNPDRKFSLVCYLNSDWLGTDGGELRIYRPGHTEKIEPGIEKAVLFRSATLEHEVLAATRPRMSITGWLKTV